MALCGDLDVCEKNKMAEDGESSLDQAFAKVYVTFLALRSLTSIRKKQFNE